MALFKPFALKVKSNLDKMTSTSPLFSTSINVDELWDKYLSSFPEGTNPVFRERTEHDCTCCRQFIRSIGGVVAVDSNYNVLTVWDDVSLGNEYDVVAAELRLFVLSHAIDSLALFESSKVGTELSVEVGEAGQSRSWNHFYGVLPTNFKLCPIVLPQARIPSRRGEFNLSVESFKRSLLEIDPSAVEVVIEMVESNSIYRGNEHLHVLKELQRFQKELEQVPSGKRETWFWATAADYSSNHETLRFRGTVIGSLLEDLTKGKELDAAVNAFEKKVAPQNYKRPSAVVTSGMIKKAEQKVSELGLTESLERRFAVYDDITINNVLFADLAATQPSGAFGGLLDGEVKTERDFSRIESVSAADFVSKILPKAHSLSVYVGNNLENRLVSLIAPVNADAPSLFKWGNPFSWSYNGEFADSIKERVKKAGGRVDGFLRVSLSWFNNDDLDLHMLTPRGHVYFSQRQVAGIRAKLDIDMNGMDGLDPDRKPVENIIFTGDKGELLDGLYTFKVDNFNKREDIDKGFEIEVELDGKIQRFSHPGLKHKEEVDCITMRVKNGEITFSFDNKLSSFSASKEVWGIKTESFVPVEMVMESPNAWDGKVVGNKHLFFMLKGCINPLPTRGFYNEYLKNELNTERKVFELLAGKMKAPVTSNQLSGVGFSETQKEELIVKVSGSYNRTIKVVF